MTQQTVGILALVALLLPTGGAILARLIGRKFGARATRWVGGLSFVVALGSALALRSAEIDRMALGQMAIFVPAEGPLIDANAFTLPRSAPAAPEAPDLAVVEPTATIALPSPTTPPPLSPTAQPSATAAATIRPADPPSPTQAPLVEPTVTPTSEPPTATTEPTATTAPTATAAPARTPTSAPQLASEPRVYIVQAGDTLRSIAASYDLSAGVLQRYNGLTDAEADSLQLDQRLFIPPRSAAAPAAAPRPAARPPTPTPRPAAPPSTPTPRPVAQPQAYIVEPGDTLRSIAASYDLSAGVLQRYNGLTDAEADSLRPGQRLFIPPR